MSDHVDQEVNGSIGGSFYSNVPIKHPIVRLMWAALWQGRSTVTPVLTIVNKTALTQ